MFTQNSKPETMACRTILLALLLIVSAGIVPSYSYHIIMLNGMCDSLDICAERFNGLPGIDFGSDVTKSTFDSFCSLVWDYHNCYTNNSNRFQPVVECINSHLDRYSSSGSDYTLGDMTAYNTAFAQAVCGTQAKSTALANLECWNSNATHRAMVQCALSAHNRTNLADTRKRICTFTQVVPGCIQESLENVCNANAANYAGNVYRVVANQMRRLYRCGDMPVQNDATRTIGKLLDSLIRRSTH